MKHLLFASLALAGSLSATAQTASQKFINNVRKPEHYRKYIASILREQSEPYTAAKTTGIKKRVVGESTWDHTVTTPVKQDTTWYKYSGNNGSKYNFDYLAYNQTYPSNFNPYDYPYLLNKVDVVSDSMKIWSTNGGSTLDLLDITKGTYTANKDVLTFDDYYYNAGAPDGADRYLNSFDGQGRLSKTINLTDMGSGYDSTTKITYTYNAQNKPLNDTIYEYDNGWVEYAAIKYTYDGAGNVQTFSIIADIGIGWVPVVVYTHTFYPNNKVKTVIIEQFGSVSLEPAVKDSFAYDPSNSFTVHTTEWNYNNMAWEPSLRITRHLNAQNLPDTTYQWQWNGNAWEKVIINYLTFDTDGNPTQLNTYDAFTSALQNKHYYYYQQYNDAQKVKETSIASDFVLYPNPAKDVITLKSRASLGKNISMQVVNSNGQVVVAGTQPWQQEATTVELPDMTPGMYFISIRDDQGTVLHRQSFLKQ